MLITWNLNTSLCVHVFWSNFAYPYPWGSRFGHTVTRHIIIEYYPHAVTIWIVLEYIIIIVLSSVNIVCRKCY